MHGRQVVVDLEAGEVAVGPLPDRRVRAGGQAHDGDEPPGQVAAAGHEVDGHGRATGAGEVVVDGAGRTPDRGVGHQPDGGPTGGDLHGRAHLEVLERLGLAPGTEQHPRAALPGEKAAGAVDGIDDVAPRAPGITDDEGLVVALHHRGARPAVAECLERGDERGLGPSVDPEDVVAALGAHDPVVVVVAVVADASDLSRPHRVAHCPADLGQRGGEELQVDQVVRLRVGHLLSLACGHGRHPREHPDRRDTG